MADNHGGPAYPLASDQFFSSSSQGGAEIRYQGMTLRQWYAGLAMQGVIMSGEWDMDDIADRAFRVADAMIAESEK